MATLNKAILLKVLNCLNKVSIVPSDCLHEILVYLAIVTYANLAEKLSNYTLQLTWNKRLSSSRIAVSCLPQTQPVSRATALMLFGITPFNAAQ